MKVRAPIIVNQFDHVCPSPTISSPVSLSLSSQLFCPYRRKYAHASFSLSLHHRNTSTLLCMLLLDTTMKCKVDSNGLIACKAWVGFGRKLQTFKNMFFCIFEASGINFTHRCRGLRQYSCHMADLNGFGWGGGWRSIREGT